MDVYFIVSFAFIFAAFMEYILLLLDTGVKKQRIDNGTVKNNNDEDNEMVLLTLFVVVLRLIV